MSLAIPLLPPDGFTLGLTPGVVRETVRMCTKQLSACVLSGARPTGTVTLRQASGKESEIGPDFDSPRSFKSFGSGVGSGSSARTVWWRPGRIHVARMSDELLARRAARGNERAA